jgi:hypothetical protein
VWVIGVAAFDFLMKHDIEPGDRYDYTFIGVGTGLSVLPVGFEGSPVTFPNAGTQLYKINPFLGKAPPIYAEDLAGLPTLILAVGANLYPPLSGGALAVYWGAGALPVPPLGHILYSRYALLIAGMHIGIPNASITLYVGRMGKYQKNPLIEPVEP